MGWPSPCPIYHKEINCRYLQKAATKHRMKICAILIKLCNAAVKKLRLQHRAFIECSPKNKGTFLGENVQKYR